MGSGGSKEVALPASHAQATASATKSLQDDMVLYEHQKSAAESAYREAEDAIFREGFKRGRQETLESMEQEIAKAARVAYANESLADEKRRIGDLAKEVDTLRKTQIRPPLRDTECKQEEAAYLACIPNSGNRQCAEVIRQYKFCADGTVAKFVNPRSQQLQ